jgi:quercetin dioxygenase-like cupin family protein
MDFTNGETLTVTGGATIESGLVTGIDEFEGLHELGYHRLTKGFQYHSHKHRGWIVACVLKGRLRVDTEGHEQAQVFGPGETYFVEPGSVHTETALEDALVLVIMSCSDPGSEDYPVAGYPAHTIEITD